MSDRGSQSSTPILRRAGPRSVEGFPGWIVEEQFPHGLEYREAGRIVRFDSEMTSSTSGYDILLYHPTPGEMHWARPHEAEPLDAVTERRILARVSASLALLGIKPAWEPFAVEHAREDWPFVLAEAKALLARAD